MLDDIDVVITSFRRFEGEIGDVALLMLPNRISVYMDSITVDTNYLLSLVLRRTHSPRIPSYLILDYATNPMGRCLLANTSFRSSIASTSRRCFCF